MNNLQRSLRSRPGPTGKRAAALFLLAIVVGLIAFGGVTTLVPRVPVVHAQTTPSSDDDKWAQDAANKICDDEVQADQYFDGCSDSDVQSIQQALHDCLVFVAGNSSVDNPTTRRSCDSYVGGYDSGGRPHPKQSFDAIAVGAALDALVSGEVARYRGLGLGEAVLGPFAATLRACFAGNMVQRAGYDSLYASRPCEDAYAGLDDAAVAPLLAQFDADPLVALSGATAFRGTFRDCVKAEIVEGAGDPNVVYSDCYKQVVPAAPVQGPGVAPTITSLGCLPNPVPAGQPLTCTTTVDKAADALQWSAPGGSPNAKTVQGLGDNFTTTYANDGQKTIELTACNHIAATAQAPAHDACSVKDVTVTVQAVTATISTFACAPTIAAVNQVVSCQGDVSNSTGATTRKWLSDGDPPQGSGTNYSVTFSRAGAHQVTFTACNGSACDTRGIPILVQAAATPSPTPARAAPTFAGTWNANNGTWTFTQNGNNVTASIKFSTGGGGSGMLQGTVSNGTITNAPWHCNSDCQLPAAGGTVTLTLSADGCSATGSYMETNVSHSSGSLTMTKQGCSA